MLKIRALPPALALLLLAPGPLGAAHITHGPIIGRPEPTSMAVWARTNAPSTFTVTYRVDAAGSQELHSGPVATKPERDCTGFAILENLIPDTRYLITVIAEGMSAAGPTGSFRTLPDPSRCRDPVHNPRGLFNFSFDEILNDIWGAGTPGLRDRRAAFRDIGVEAWYHYLGWSNPVAFEQGIVFGKAQVRAESDVLVDDDAGFTKLDLAQATTLLMHWGDATAGVNDNDLDGVGGDPNAGVYRVAEVLDARRLRIEPAARAGGEVSYSIGRRSYFRKTIANCDFFVCDTRGQREMHDTKDPYKKGLSHLGLEQKKWLIEGTRDSEADFIFVFSTVNFMVPHIGGGAVRATNKDDAWTVFFEEREELIEHFDSLGKKVFLCTGDLHNSFVAKITENVWEFASGPHNSANHIIADEGNRPLTGPFKYGPRECDIRWSTGFLPDVPRDALRSPSYCVVQVNNVHDNSLDLATPRWIAYERPQVVFQYFDGRTGRLRYAEALVK